MYFIANSSEDLSFAAVKSSTGKSLLIDEVQQLSSYNVRQESLCRSTSSGINIEVSHSQDVSSEEKNTECHQIDLFTRHTTSKGNLSTLLKLTSRIQLLFGILFLSSQFHVTKCSANIQPSPYNYNSTVFGNNVIPLLMELVRKRPLNIQLLYEGSKEETAHQLSVQLSKEMSNMMAFRFDNHTVDSIDIILRAATIHASLMTLCNFENVIDIFGKMKSKMVKSHSVSWILIIGRDEWKSDTKAALQSLIFEGTRVTVLIQESNEEFLVYSADVKEDGIMRLYFRGTWRSKFDDKQSQLKAFYDPDHYSDLNGRQLYIAANHDPPYMELGPVQTDGSILATSGFDLSIVQSLSKNLNFTYKIFSPADGAWGYPQPDGTITGMIGMVARREVHFAVAGIAMNPTRKKIIDYAVPYYLSYMCIYSRSPRKKSRDLAVFSSFRSEVWICIILATLAIGPILRIQSKVLEKSSSGMNTQDLLTYSFNMFRNLVVQGNLIESSSWSQRIIFFTWYIFCLIIYVLYSGTLTAVFAVPSYEKPVDSLEDLPRAVEDGFTITVVGDSYHEYLFKEAKQTIYKDTWKLFNHADRSKSFVENTEKGMRLVLEEKTIHMTSQVNGKIFAAKLGRQKFHLSRDFFGPGYAAFALQQGFPYVKAFDQVIQRLGDAGIINKWFEDEIGKTSKETEDTKESRLLVISLANFQAAFFLLFLGYFIATLALVVETAFTNIFFDW